MKILAKALETNHGLISLDLGINRKINDDSAPAIAEFLAHNSVLRTLDLRATDIYKEGFKVIEKGLEQNKTLTELLSYSGITSKIKTYLKRNIKLAESRQGNASSDVP